MTTEDKPGRPADKFLPASCRKFKIAAGRLKRCRRQPGICKLELTKIANFKICIHEINIYGPPICQCSPGSKSESKNLKCVQSEQGFSLNKQWKSRQSSRLPQFCRRPCRNFAAGLPGFCSMACLTSELMTAFVSTDYESIAFLKSRNDMAEFYISSISMSCARLWIWAIVQYPLRNSASSCRFPSAIWFFILSRMVLEKSFDVCGRREVVDVFFGAFFITKLFCWLFVASGCSLKLEYSWRGVLADHGLS